MKTKKHDSKMKSDYKKKSDSEKQGDSTKQDALPAGRRETSQPPEPAAVAVPVRRGRPSARLTPDQLAELLEILTDSDSVELKVTIPETSHRSTIEALDMDPLNAQIRQVYFHDTPDLALFKAGVVVRARRIQGKGADSVVKLRPVVPQSLPSDLRKSPAFVVEVDAMPGGFVCSGSLKGRTDPESVRQVAAGRLPLRKLFTKPQRALFRDHAPEGLQLDDLRVLGPIFVLKLPFAPVELGRRVAAEMWLYPDGSRILELSTKTLPGEALAVFTKARQFLDERGVDRSGDQQAKTRRALSFFAKELSTAMGNQVEPEAKT